MTLPEVKKINFSSYWFNNWNNNFCRNRIITVADASIRIGQKKGDYR
jgi:hypothetical protein